MGSFRRSIRSLAACALMLALGACVPKKQAGDEGEVGGGGGEQRVDVRLQLSTTELDFGQLAVDVPVTQAFQVKNIGAEPAVIQAVVTSACNGKVHVTARNCGGATGLRSNQICAIDVTYGSTVGDSLNACKVIVNGAWTVAVLGQVASGENQTSGLQLTGDFKDVYSSEPVANVVVRLLDEFGQIDASQSGSARLEAVPATGDCEAVAPLSSAVGGVVNNTASLTRGEARFGGVAFALKATVRTNLRLRASFGQWKACSPAPFAVKPIDASLKAQLGTNPRLQWKLTNEAWNAVSTKGRSESNPIQISEGASVPAYDLRAANGNPAAVISLFRDHQFLMTMHVQQKNSQGVWVDTPSLFFYNTSGTRFADSYRFWAMEFPSAGVAYGNEGALRVPSGRYMLKAQYPVTTPSTSNDQIATNPNQNQVSLFGTATQTPFTTIILNPTVIPTPTSTPTPTLTPTPTPSSSPPCATYRIVFRSLGGTVLANAENNEKLFVRSCRSTTTNNGGAISNPGNSTPAY